MLENLGALLQAETATYSYIQNINKKDAPSSSVDSNEKNFERRKILRFCFFGKNPELCYAK